MAAGDLPSGFFCARAAAAPPPRRAQSEEIPVSLKKSPVSLKKPRQVNQKPYLCRTYRERGAGTSGGLCRNRWLCRSVLSGYLLIGRVAAAPALSRFNRRTAANQPKAPLAISK